MTRNLKIFLATAFPSALCLAVVFSHFYGHRIGLISGLSSGLVIGALMVFILGFLHDRAVRKIDINALNIPEGNIHIRELKLLLPYEKAFDICIASVSSIKGCTIRAHNRNMGRIEAATGINWKTWGDTITFEIQRMDNKNTQVIITSSPSARTTLVDFGKNLENVEKITSYIRNALNL